MPSWYDKNLKKHWKDYGAKDYGHEILNLWHISPEKIVFPSAKSSFQGVAGAYFSPSYKSLLSDWAMYVAGKKQVKDGIENNFLSLFDREEEIVEEYNSGKKKAIFMTIQNISK